MNDRPLAEELYPRITFEELSDRISARYEVLTSTDSAGKAYDPDKGNYIIAGVLASCQCPVKYDGKSKESLLLDKIIALIQSLVDFGAVPMPIRLWIYLGITEAEYNEVRRDVADWRHKLFAWYHLFCEAVNQQNMIYGNLHANMRIQLDQTRSGGEFVKDDEKINITNNTLNIHAEAKMKSDEIMARFNTYLIEE